MEKGQQGFPKGIYQGFGFKKGHKTWNKGKKSLPQCGYQKGHPTYLKHHTEETKKKMGGDKRYNWTGDNASYGAIHKWIQLWKGRPPCCENCGKIGKKNGRCWSIHWANIDNKYRRVLEDYIALCAKCHSAYDRRHAIVKVEEVKVEEKI